MVNPVMYTFLIAFGEFLLALPQKEPKGLGNSIAPHELPGQRTTTITTGCKNLFI